MIVGYVPATVNRVWLADPVAGARSSYPGQADFREIFSPYELLLPEITLPSAAD
jgi:hypothetical protein